MRKLWDPATVRVLSIRCVALLYVLFHYSAILKIIRISYIRLLILMQNKDYYQILEVSPNASPEEIRRSFRKLALLYHPDKNNGDNLAEERFKEIKEAYEILSNTRKRQDYHYKRFASSYQYKIITPDIILQQCIDLKKFISVIHHSYIDFDMLAAQIQDILSTQSLDVLQKNNDHFLNNKIIQLILLSCNPLPYRQFLLIAPLLISISNVEKNIAEIETINQHKKRVHYFEKYKLLIAILMAAIICVLIYSTTK